jgi:hypothetical protein
MSTLSTILGVILFILALAAFRYTCYEGRYPFHESVLSIIKVLLWIGTLCLSFYLIITGVWG